MVSFILILISLAPVGAGTDDVGGVDMSEEEFSAKIDSAAQLLESDRTDSAMSLAFGLMDVVDDGCRVSDLEFTRLHLLIGNGYCLQGLYDSGKVILEKTIDLASGNRSADSLRADAYCVLGHQYAAQEQFQKAVDCLRQAVEIRVGVDGPDTRAVALDVYWLGMYLLELDQYEEAEAMFIESLRIREKVLGPDHMDVARSLSTLAGLCLDLYEHDQALGYALRALSIVENAPDRLDNAVASVLGQVATIYRSQGQYGKAEPLYLRAMNIWKSQATPDLLNVAGCMRNLGSLYESQGRYSEAEECYYEALRIRVEKLGTDHPAVAGTLNCLGNLYFKQGRWDEAEEHFNQVMAIWKRRGDDNSLGLAKCLISMAGLYQAQEDWLNAEKYARRALEIREAVLPLNHPDIADALNRLGSNLTQQGRYAEAEPLIQRVVSINCESLGPRHPLVASGLINMARLCRGQGRDAEAESCLKQALAIREEVLGLKHPNVFIAQRELACLYAETGRIRQSIELHRQSQRSRHEFVADVFSSSSESQKLRWIKKMPLIDGELIWLALTQHDRDLDRMTMEMVLQGKSAVNEAVMAENRAAFCSEDTEVIHALNERVSVCTEISNLALNNGLNGSPDRHRERMLSLYLKKDSLDERLSRTCSVFDEMVSNREASIDDVAASLPPGSALWEYVRYEPIEYDYTGAGNTEDAPARYVGMILADNGEVQMIDLGEADTIDSLIQEFLSNVNEAVSRINSAMLNHMEKLLANTSEELYRSVFAPLAARCDGRTEIIISPDGSLSLLPFETLSMPEGTYVIEEYRLSYMSSGRDLIRLGRDRRHEVHRALVMADPDFGVRGDGIPGMPDTDRSSDEAPAVGILEPMRGTADCLEEEFSQLQFTRVESEAVARTIRDRAGVVVDEKYGPEATESLLKNLTEPPDILHVATHGFACSGNINGDALDNPLLRSGLVLAGANQRRQDARSRARFAEDGLLTAFEVSGLNLMGTELVGLSACKTGVGEVVSGEGVFGLRRAFQHAGARSILMSLWKVPDRQTSALMEGFYTQWLGGMSKRDALREAALEIISSSRAARGCAHPILWGGFILVGDWE